MDDKLPEGLSNVRFKHVQPDPGGDILTLAIGSTYADGSNIVVGLHATSRYIPETREEASVVMVLEGEGDFHLAGKEYRYGPCSCFEVPSNTMHGFVAVDTDTVFVKKIRFGEERKRFIRNLVATLADTIKDAIASSASRRVH